MSLLPLLFDDSWMAPSYARREAPRRNLWDEVIQPLALVNSLLESPEYLRSLNSLQQQTSSQMVLDKDKFHANFDVQHFKPEEITIKVTGENTITVEAKHEEKQDEHGQIYRHFLRKYVLPKNCDMSRLESKLSSDGVLSITAPTVGDKVDRNIPISQTGKPARSVENKAENAQQKSKM
ncbi:unnamed protein product [Psylliodes chrysocephalus]|uniref:SHSP domain-containing protein n=1 Tax=Psylliodes chrysocephalus TaxID=3402493 RepID=A0A9P0GBV1_9CUCU|nr:unnamed protein product [Psylliodes chrysocephala]